MKIDVGPNMLMMLDPGEFITARFFINFQSRKTHKPRCGFVEVTINNDPTNPVVVISGLRDFRERVKVHRKTE